MKIFASVATGVVLLLSLASTISHVHAFSTNLNETVNATKTNETLKAAQREAQQLYIPSGCNQPIRVPATVNQFSQGVAVANTYFCLNADGHYHLRGLVQNTLPESRDFGSITITLQDNSTGTDLTSKSGILGVSHVQQGRVVEFDIDTGYTASEKDQLVHMRAVITV